MKYKNDIAFIEALGKRIRQLRTSKKMTQLDLGIASDMEENAVQRIEAGRTNPPTIKTLFKIITALDVDFKKLFDF